MPGAAILAATAALRAGAGKLQIGVPAPVSVAVAVAVPEALVVGFDESEKGAPDASSVDRIAERARKADAFVIGPGMTQGEVTNDFVRAVLERTKTAVVVDAAALFALRSGAKSRRSLILTPHAGEMATMLDVAREEVEADPFGYAVTASRAFDAVVVMKGETTYVTAPDGTAYVNTDGDIGLATSGSGDTLAGIIGGLLARGLDPARAAAWGVALHARAGKTLSRKMGMGFLARELLECIPYEMRRLTQPGSKRRSR